MSNRHLEQSLPNKDASRSPSSRPQKASQPRGIALWVMHGDTLTPMHPDSTHPTGAAPASAGRPWETGVASLFPWDFTQTCSPAPSTT